VLLPIQRKLIFECKHQIVLVGGRDICSTILPGAFSDLKLYINAKVKTRAERRYKELKLKKIAKNIDFKQILKALKARDLADKTRKTSPLKKTKDSILIDNNSNDISRALKKIVFLIEREIKNISGSK
ncbi:MAG: (d)CMP kinase, partial [Pelagibacteraceae bacterium]